MSDFMKRCVLLGAGGLAAACIASLNPVHAQAKNYTSAMITHAQPGDMNVL